MDTSHDMEFRNEMRSICLQQIKKIAIDHVNAEKMPPQEKKLEQSKLQSIFWDQMRMCYSFIK